MKYMFDYLLSLGNNTVFNNLLIISGVFWAIWWRVVCYRGWLIDDYDGIAKYSSKYDTATDKVIDSYDIDCKTKEGKPTRKPVRYLNYIQELGFPGALLRFVRLHLGRRFCEIGKNKNGHPVFGYIQDPSRHHFISLISQQINLVLAYLFLRQLFGDQVSFLTVLIFAVNPLCCQTVAWISGINYLWSLMGGLAVLNTAVYATGLLISIPLVIFFSAYSTFTLLTGGFTWLVLLVLGKYWEALASFLVSGVILWKVGREVIIYRTAAFKEQNMGRSTFFNFKKPVVMLKTLFYYVCLVPFPMRLGLFHSWGYHYDEQVERPDRMFWGGLASLIILLSFIFLPTNLIFRLGSVWFLAYLIPFLNVITAQQFVVDRYIFIPTFGWSLLLAHFLGWSPIFFVILGLYAMRTIVQLPTYRNDENFYLSNSINFNSEVALGNLGVTQMNMGMYGSAVDSWMKATRINAFYDVPWYNLFSIFKGNGHLEQACSYLKNCLKSKTIHFRNQWVKELESLESEIRSRKGLDLATMHKYMEKTV